VSTEGEYEYDAALHVGVGLTLVVVVVAPKGFGRIIVNVALEVDVV